VAGTTRSLFSATATPLASIFGSGFLVIVPILAAAVGRYAVLAMACVCALAYAVGSVIRFNIRHAEPLLEKDQAPPVAADLEKASDLALVMAYAISVCLYIKILASFLLDGFGVDNALNERIVAILIIATIGVVGFFKGLDLLQKLEKLALGVTLVIMAALLVGFAVYGVGAQRGDGIQLPGMPGHSVWDMLTIVGGTLIVVQGFETSRYLADEYDTETRVRSCRFSQLFSTGFYLLFVALATPLMHFLGDKPADNALIMLAGKASHLLPVPLIAAAVLSQFSAAVADTIGGGGNTAETTKGHIDAKHAYLVICGIAVSVAFMSTHQVLALASRAFAFYYLMQCLVAFAINKRAWQRVGIAAVAAVLLFITLFAVPAG
jgi:hypothetical protein